VKTVCGPDICLPRFLIILRQLLLGRKTEKSDAALLIKVISKHSFLNILMIVNYQLLLLKKITMMNKTESQSSFSAIIQNLEIQYRNTIQLLCRPTKKIKISSLQHIQSPIYNNLTMR